MFDLSIQKLDIDKGNLILQKTINLDTNLDCFFLISSKNHNLAESISNNIIENIIDKVSKAETYNDFGIALENINAFLKTWRADNPVSEGEKEAKLDIVISILNENEFMFSNIGKTGVYMINSNSQITELTEKAENKKEFLYISNGTLANGDIIIESTINLLKYLSKSDLIDGMILSDDMDIFCKNIKNILKTEILKKNCLVSSMRYENEFQVDHKESKLAPIKNFFMSVADTNLVKKTIGTSLVLKDKIDLQSKTVKNTVFIASIVLSIIFLYFIISKIVGVSTQTELKEEVKTSIIQVRKVLTTASENIGNPEIFRLNISKAETMVSELQEKNLFKGDIKKINDEISILKNQFDKVEVFTPTKENSLFLEKVSQVKMLLKKSGKIFIITKNGLIGPIIEGQKGKIYTFNDLKENEYFKDYAVIGTNIFLLTNTSKIVRFSSSGRFSFANVSGQSRWENMKSIKSYSTNLYSLGEDNQIYKHRALKNNFSAKTPYLKEEDRKQIGDILDFSIDGGFYIVKNNLEVMKFFSSPYGLNSLFLNKLPKNYSLEEGGVFKIKSGFKLNYVYMLLNNKIWVFKTNSNNYKNTRDLNYLGQIELSDSKLIDFFVETDGEIILLNNEGVFKLKFEVSDDRLVIR
ncbi:hypothetical protein CSB07_02020 [Candidatus Gracilibacteria bacterium]|nr:MAG: hypothetical protein CSB07_02020 [Candidatus Gracilibacteria bacterium]